MKQSRQTNDVQEAIGIVISAGVSHDVTPRFTAYVWAPGPEPLAAASASDAEPRAA